MSSLVKSESPVWQNYVAERDELFLRSKTVSVREMATTLAHELNQPLGTVSNILHGLQIRLSETPGDSECQEAVDLALQQTQFAARVIARMRDFTESRQPDFVDFNVVDLLNQSVHLLDWVFGAESVRVILSGSENEEGRCALAPPLPSELNAKGDRTMIQQVFTNLLRNAIDALRATPTDKRVVRVTVGKSIDGVKIEIKDNGHGLLGTDPDSLFKPFHSSKKDGMGVGLNICKSFIELHQGKLWITPNCSAGCTAHVLLRNTL